MKSIRFNAISLASQRKAVKVEAPTERPSVYFGENVFNRKAMVKYLSEHAYNSIIDTIDNGNQLDRSLAGEIAKGMKEWAMEKGATHYTHWFQPLTGGTAEKHDAFVEHDHKGGMIEEFSGKLLIQQEPDASSFPNGGIRNTFEARGYSAWDPSSPAFVIDDTLCIPTVFISYTGESLDYKTPLIKSINTLDKAATAVAQLFDSNVNRVTTFLGWEQEYFLVDEALYSARPDLMMTGRTLMGHESAKNQQLEDHYFGSIPTRVVAYMKDLEFELLKLGVPAKTRHNEVAPNQFELAPIYEEANLANDHNLLCMSVMKKVARRHNFRLLLHEKPYKGVNGSGKHNNWSLGTNTGVNLLSPGKNSADNLQFVTFLVNVLMAVYRHNGLLKASISTATNAQRLGGGEAPPAIISCFLGTQLSDVLDKLENATENEAIMFDEKKGLELGIAKIPEILLDNTDRNRTSPFAFTGNRFEFRALGSSANSAVSMIVINAAVAEQLTIFRAEIDELMGKGETLESALFVTIKKYIKLSKAIRFDGNGYGEAWHKEAERRGLNCDKNVPVIYDQYLLDQSVKMFENMGVMSHKELHSRCEVKWEMYTKKVQIEGRVLGDIAMNHIIPVAARYISILLDNIMKMNSCFTAAEAEELTKSDKQLVKEITSYTDKIKQLVKDMTEARKQANKIESEREKAIAYYNNVAPAIEEIRDYIDELEIVVDDEMWTLPKYRELLFSR